MGLEWRDIPNEDAAVESGYAGRDLVEETGAKIVMIDQVLVAAPGRSVALIRIGLLGTSWHFVPLDGAHESGNDVVVPYSKEFVKRAPAVKAGGNPSERDLAELRHYYGLTSPDPSTH